MLNNFAYALNEIDEKIFLKVIKNNCENPKFLYDNLNNEIKIYQCDDRNHIFYDFFGKVFFELKKENLSFLSSDLKNNNTNLKKNEYFSFYISQNDYNLKDEELSVLLRGSSTLIMNEKNCYDDKQLIAMLIFILIC